MSSLLERAIESLDQRLVVVAPPEASIPRGLSCQVVNNEATRASLLCDVRRLRGRVYVADGAFQPDQLWQDERRYSSDDHRSWHLIMNAADGKPEGCIRVLPHEAPVGLQDLRAQHTPLARDYQWREPLKQAIAADSRQAERQRLQYAEVGGWAVSETARRSPVGILLILAVYALGEHLGGSIVIATATARNASATILRRLGGAPLEYGGQTLPSYCDPQYRCDMELLRFDTRRPAARYAEAVRRIGEQMQFSPVFEASTLEQHVPDLPVPIPVVHDSSIAVGAPA